VCSIAAGDRARGTTAQKAAAFESYASRCGCYAVVSERERVVVHTRELENIRDLFGATEQRTMLERSPTTLKYRTGMRVVQGKKGFVVWTRQRAK
jgi:Lipocalin-like domain